MGITRFARTLSTTDIKLAASLMACGCPPVPGEEVSITTGTEGPRAAFNFLDTSLDGRFQTAALMRAWKQEREARTEGETFHAQNPEHPLSYLMAGWTNYMAAREYVMKAVPKLFIKKGNSVALIDQTAPQRIQDHLLGKIGV